MANSTRASNDTMHFKNMAKRGVIPTSAIGPLVEVLDAMRKAQTMMGPGHDPLQAVAEALPRRYVENWIDERRGKPNRAAL